MLRIRDEWAGFQFDSCVGTIGLGIDTASQERVNLGNDTEPNWVNRYSMLELLDQEFQIYPDESDDIVKTFGGLQGIMYDEVR